MWLYKLQQKKLIIAVIFFVVIGFGVLGFSYSPARAETCTQWESPLTSDIVGKTQFVADATKVCQEVQPDSLSECIIQAQSDWCVQSGTDATPVSDNKTKTKDSVVAETLSVTIPVVGMVFKTILWLLNLIMSVLISLMGGITAFVLEFNMSILDFNPPFVAVGWTIFRDLANLGFVFGIIVIAIATILRYKEYTAKQILIKLIIAALVVNFSLVIGGVFIQISNTISAYLLSATTGATVGNIGASTIAKIGDSFGYMKLVNSTSNWGAGGIAGTFLDLAGITSGASLGVILALLVILVFGLIFFFSLVAYAGMLFMRYFWLSFLLMVAPMTWLLWVFPSTKNYFRKWWDYFLKWTAYTPIVLVFTYVALAIMSKYAQYDAAIKAKLGQQGAWSAGDNNNIDIGSLLAALFACALLIGGMKMASAMGVGGTKMVLGGWDKAVKKTKSWTRERAKWVGARTGDKLIGKDSKAGKFMQKNLIKWGTSNAKSWKEMKETKDVKGMVKRGLGYATGVTAARNIFQYGAGEAAQGLAVGQVKLQKDSQKLSETYNKRLGKLSPDQIAELWPTLNTNERVATLSNPKNIKKLKMDDHTTTEGLFSTLEYMKKIGKDSDAESIEIKFGLNDDIIKYVRQIHLDPSNATAIANLKDAFEKSIVAMSEKDFEEYAKSMTGPLMEGKNVFGIASNNFAVPAKNYLIQESAKNPSMARVLSANVHDKIEKGVVMKKLRRPYFEQLMQKHLDYMKSYAQGLDSSNPNQEKILGEESDFRRRFTLARTLSGQDFYKSMKELLGQMKSKNSSTFEETRDFARSVKMYP